MYDVDIDKFWKDDAEAHRDNCFFEGAPQVALGIRNETEYAAVQPLTRYD